MNDLLPLEPGRVKCLKCYKEFDSIDKCTNRTCPPCARANSREYIPRSSSSHIHTGDSSGSFKVDD